MNPNHSHARAFSRTEAITVCGIALLSSAILLPALAQGNPFDFFGRARENARRASCQSNLKQVGLGFLQYVQDYDEKMPSATSSGNIVSAGGYGWSGVLQPYLQSTQIFQCPSEKHTMIGNPDVTKPNYTDYWMNSRASGLELAKFNSPAQTILSGDGDGGSPNSNARYNISSLPYSWRITPGSPARRHLETGNYLWVDGHVKALFPKIVTMAPLNQMAKYGADWTFSPN